MGDYGLALRPGMPLGIIVVPTRELAMQAARLMKLICQHAKLRVRLVMGGAGTRKKQQREIAQVVDVLVATPDRLLKFYRDKDIKFDDVAHIAIDEADFMLTQGFADLYELLNAVQQKSRRKKIQYTLVTASMTKPLWRLFQEDTRWRNIKVLESKSLHK